ncbi:MAG: IPT/TIG domain-containing protein [Brevundimonas sp.]
MALPSSALAQSLIPYVDVVEPTRGPPSGGTSVIIRGSNLTGATAVHFGSTPATSFVFFNGGASIRATAPPGIGTVNVSVTSLAGTSEPTASVYYFNYESVTLSGYFPSPQIGVPYSQSFLAATGRTGPALAATGGTGPYTFAITSGSLPPGMTFDTSGTLSGTPTGNSPGGFTVRVTDSAGQFGTGHYDPTVSTPNMSVTNSVPAARRGVSYSQTLIGSGATAPYSFVLHSGSLPAGLTLTNAGLLAGTPTVTGSFPVVVRVTDSSTGGGYFPYSILANLTVVVDAAEISVTPTILPSVMAGVEYDRSLSAAGGAGSYSYAVNSGALPVT